MGPAGDELHAVDRNGRPSHRLRAYRYGKRMGISTAEARERLGLRPQRMKGPGSLVSRPLTQPISTELFALSFWAASGRLFDLEARLTKFTTRLHHRCRNKKTRTGNPLCGAKLPAPVELPQRAFFAVQKLYRQSQTFNRLSGWDAAPNAFAKEMTDGE
jgi:hypothetical protein